MRHANTHTELRLRSRLIARHDALSKTLREDWDSFQRSSDEAGVRDDGDAAVDSENEEVCSQLVEIETRELGQIEHALERIAAGLHGRCEFCGGKIPASRLNALPYTTSCIRCQREIERRSHSSAQKLGSSHWARVYAGSIEAADNEGESDILTSRMIVADLAGCD
jgi:DnaK suppressor protein